MKATIKKGFFIFTALLFLGTIFAQEYSNQEIPEQPENRPSVALVLSGGGAKGFAHIAVLEVIEELGIPIDMIIGNSIGSIIGGLYCAGYSTQEMLGIIQDVNWARIFQDSPVSNFESLLGNRGTLNSPISFKLKKNLSFETDGGLSTGQNAYMLFKKLTAKIPSYVEFDSLHIPFRAAAVNLLTGELDLIKSGDLAEAIRSSMSIPAVFQPFPVDDKLYVDGFVRNNTPIQPATDMGYDIVIAVDLGGNIVGEHSSLDSPTLSTVTQVLTIFMYSANSGQFEKADVVLYPEQDDFSMFDFQKSQEIYQHAVREKDKYRKALLKVREQIYPDKTEPTNSEKTNTAKTNGQDIFSFTPITLEHESKKGAYKKLPEIIPEKIVIHGAVPMDISFIQSQFEKNLQGKPLTAENLESFVTGVYTIGNYSLVLPRIDTRREIPQMELILHKISPENWVIIPSATFEGTMTNNSICKLSFGLDVQFRGLTGTGSVLAARLNMINDFGAALMFMQPIGHHTYLQLFADAAIEQEFITSGFSVQDINANRLSYASTGLLVGIRFNKMHRMHTGGAVYWIDSKQVSVPQIEQQEQKYPDVFANVAAPLNISYIFNTLDYPVSPSKGFYVKVDNTGVFPLFGENTPVAFNMVKAEFTAAIPVSDKFTLAINMLAGSDITRQLQKIPSLIPMFGYALGDRTFFPQISGKQQLGTHKGAAQLVLQFQPWQNLTILGGQLFISVSGSIGEVAMDYTDFNLSDIQWNASLNAGIRINKGFSITCRFGAGTTGNSVMPFLSMDFGSIRY